MGDMNSQLRTLYPITEPFASGTLERPGTASASTQHIAYFQHGNPDGIPAVFIHGGPGGGTSPVNASFFDPEKYHIVLIDQRGCGQSTPHMADPEIDPVAELSGNTTPNLIEDIEAIREHLGIERWLVFGGSWGSTLSLAYAQAHPERVLALVLRGIFMLRKTELDWYYNGGAAHIYPDVWERYLSVIPEGLKPPAHDIHGRTHLNSVDLMKVYNELLMSPDYEVASEAAKAWSVWEGATSYLHPHDTDEHEDPRFAVAFARIENHYFVHGGFMEDGQLLANIDLIRYIPGVIVQGRYDVVCPPISAWQLHKAWPEAEFHWSPTSGHASFEAETVDTLVRATDRFAEELKA